MFRSFFAAVFLIALPYTASAQDICTTVGDLTRLFSTLQAVGEQRGSATTQQINDIQDITVRYDAHSVDYFIANSPIGAQKAFVNAAFERAYDIMTDLNDDQSRSTLATHSSTAATLQRALAVLGRMDCTPPVGDATETAPETDLPRASDSVSSGTGIGPVGVLTWLPILIALISLILAGGVAFHLYQKRVESLRRRFSCNLDATFIPPDITLKRVTGRIVDISRSGIKFRPDTGLDPQNSDRVSVSINGVKFPMRVRWQNAHYFGATFEHFLSEKALRGLIGVKTAKVRRKNLSPAPQHANVGARNT